MASFNEISGVPSTGNHWLLTTVLRDEWGFEGIVVSDYTGDQEMIAHGYARDGRDAARLAFMAGVDISMESGLYRDHLPGLVRDGAVPQARLDASVRRVLAIKARLGLFDDPFRRIDPAREVRRSRLPANLALAREAAAKSIVMLRNEGGILPLKPSARLAVIGPFASGHHDLIGGWNVYGDDNQAVDLPSGLRSAGGSFTLVQGSGVEEPLAGGIEAAVAAARGADVVLLAIGESQSMSGEAQSRDAIIIPAPQQALAEAVAATGKPVIVLLKCGRALALEGAVRDAAAILVTWQLGSEAGNAIADILYGRASPSGRLPVSFPLRSGQEPYYYAHKATGRPQAPGPLEPYKAHYRGIPDRSLYPFGHGLTYGRAAYSDLQVSFPERDIVAIRATITNEGSRAAEEVAQLYVRQLSASITQPVRELKAFRKVPLAPGASAEVRFTLRREDLKFIGPELKPVFQPGTFQVWIAPSAEAEGVHGAFQLG